ncbi:MAG: hypothetical protein HY274_03170 [Gammaproteobacteria bacterium]|nr:hypothetical protein [Gammaproteobacteria bacterium]
MKRRFFLRACFLLTALTACSEPTTPAAVLYFVEREPGGEPYRTRMIVSAGFLRLDDGQDSQDFLLFDRADGSIYSVSSGEKQVLVIRPRPIELKPPTPFIHRVVTDTATFPAVEGRKVTHYELLTNDKRCYDLYAAEGLLPAAVVALREFRLILAGQQALTAATTPPEMQSACDLANNIFLPVRHLEYGFPVRLADMTGRTMELVDYKTDFRATAEIFRLPAEYKRLMLDELRGQK